MKRNTLKWFGLVVVLSMVLGLAPTALAAPVELDPNINPPKPAHRLGKSIEAQRAPSDVDVLRMLREAGRVALDASPDAALSAVDAWYRDFNYKVPDGADPAGLKKRRDALNHYLLTGERLAAAQTVEEKATLVVVVDFSGPDTVERLWPDPNDPSVCTMQTFNWEGPAFGETPAPGPLDNFHLWKPTWTTDEYRELYFGIGPDAGIGIVRPDLGGIDLSGLTMANYVQEQSGGTHMPQGDVLDQVLTLPHSHYWYGYAYATQEDGACVITDNADANGLQYYIDSIEAMKAAYPGMDYSQFDTDGDQIVDLFAVIHAGWDWQSLGGVDATSTSSTSFVSYNSVPLQVAGEGTPGDPSDDYFINGLNRLPEHLDVGAICEEYEHQFDLPDIYASDAANSNAYWGSHSAGVWGGELGGTRPMGHNLWQDVFLGWRDPAVINYDDAGQYFQIGQARYTPEGMVDGLVVNLPDILVEEVNPLDTGKGLWSGKTDQHNSLLSRELDLSGAATAAVSVNTWWDIEDDWDYGYFEVSTDGEATWTSIPDTNGYMVDTDPNDTNIGWGLTGYGMDTLMFDLTPYAGMSSVYVRFNYKTDAAVHYTGWYVDDIMAYVDGGVVYAQDFEGDYSDWMNFDWIEVPFTGTYPQAYFVEWRTKVGFDESFDTAYYPVYSNDETAEFQVDRTPYTAPVMQLSYYNGQQDFDYAIDDASFDEGPSTGPKYGHLVIESHYDPYRFDTTFDWFQDGLVGYTVYGRSAAGDAGFGLVPTEEWTIRLGYDADGNYTWPSTEEKTFAPQAPVPNFHDYLGYYPGYYYPGFGSYVYLHDWDASGVVPAEGTYTSRITWPDGEPFHDLYGVGIGPGGLGDGNPGSSGVEYGVNLCVVGQGEDFGEVYFGSSKFGAASGIAVDMTEVLPGDTLGFAAYAENLRGGADYFAFVPTLGLPVEITPDSLWGGAFPVYGYWTGDQVAGKYAEGGVEALQALSTEVGGGASDLAGIAWVGHIAGGEQDLFGFSLTVSEYASGAEFDVRADLYLCGDLHTSLHSDEIHVHWPEPVTWEFGYPYDTYVTTVLPNQNYGDNRNLIVRQRDAADAFIQFPLYIPEWAIIDDAVLAVNTVKCVNENPLLAAVHPMEGEWVDLELTWNTVPPYGDPVLENVLLNAMGARVEMNITDLVAQWVADPGSNFGVMLRGAGLDPNTCRLGASESGNGSILIVTLH